MRKSVLLASLAVVLNNVSGMNPNEEIRILRQQNCQMQNIIKYLRRANSVQRDEINRLRKANDSQTEEIDNLQQVASTKMDEIDYLLKVNKSREKEIDNLRKENVSQMDTINYLKNANDFQTNEINNLLSISNYYYSTSGYLLKKVAWWRSQFQLVSDFSCSLQEKLGYEEDSYYEEVSPIEIDENGSLTYDCESGEIFSARGGVFSPRKVDVSSRRFSMPGGLWSLENTEHQSAFNARSVKFNRDKEVRKNLSIDKKDERPVVITIAEQTVSPVVREAIESSKQLSNSENQKFLLDLFSEIEKSSSEVDVTQPEIESLNRENSEKELSEEKNNENQTEIEEKLVTEENSKNPLLIQKDIENTLENSTENTNKTLVEKRNVEEKKTILSEQKSKKKKKQTEKALFSAIQTLDIAKVQNLVNANESLINAQTNSKNTPLIMVLQNHTNDKEKIEKCRAIAHFILSKGPDFSIKNVRGDTALSEAMDYVYSYLVKPTTELLVTERGTSEDKRQEAGVAVKKFCLISRLLNNLSLNPTDYEIIKNSGDEFESEFSRKLERSSLDAARFLLESEQFNVQIRRFLPDVLDFYNKFYSAATDETRIESAIRAALDLDIDKIIEKMDSELKPEVSEENLAENQKLEDEQKDSSERKSKKKKKKKKNQEGKQPIQNNVSFENLIKNYNLNPVLKSMLSEKGYLEYQFPLLQAIKEGELDKVVYFVGLGANINYSYSESVTPLSAAIAFGQSEIVNFLITQGANCDEWTEMSDSSLESIIIAFSKKNKKFWKGKSPDKLINMLKAQRQVELQQKLVIEALRTGNLAAIISMKNQGMNLNSRIRDHGAMSSLLDYAILAGQAKIIEYLVDEKVDSNIFMLNEEEIEKVIRKSFKLNKEVWREVSLDTIINKIKAEKNRKVALISLVDAVKIGDLDKVKSLRDEGVDLNYTFWSGETLLDYAILVGQAKIIEYFLKLRMSSVMLKADEREIKAEEKEIEESIFRISEQNKEFWQGNSDQIINLIKSEKQRRKIEGDSRVVI